MTARIAITEPDKVRAGDTWAWTRQDLADYPSSAWTLKYALKNASSAINITATADGSGYAVSVSMASTASHPPGKYRWVAWVESATERFDVDTGWIEVLPKYDTTTALDDRGHARRTLEAIEAVIEGRATLDQQEYTIGSRSLKRMLIKDLIFYRDYYRGQVFAQENAERAANGKGGAQLVVRL